MWRQLHEQEAAVVNRALYDGWVADGDEAARDRALGAYLAAKIRMEAHLESWGLVNNRLFIGDGVLRVPYLVEEELRIYEVDAGASQLVARRACPPGTVHTDRSLERLGELGARVVDLERPLFLFETERTEPPRLQWLQDLADVLRAVNASNNRNEAAYLLRCLVARLCGGARRPAFAAKNLQPEARALTSELVGFLNGRHCRTFPLLTRILVRNLPELIGRPRVIDRLWNDTIALAEVHVRGSAVVNELRRICHHALGPRGLHIARAWCEWLRTGEPAGLRALGFEGASDADVQARSAPEPLELGERVCADLETLLASAGIVERLARWREEYESDLLHGGQPTSLLDALERLAVDGLQAGNQWAARRQLTVMQNIASDFAHPGEEMETFQACLAQLARALPGTAGADAADTERLARQGVDAFANALRARLLWPLTGPLEEIERLHVAGEHMAGFRAIHALRERVVEAIERGGHTTRRHHLHKLDCLLEEMGYLGLRHLDARYAEQGVDLEDCLEIVRIAIANLPLAGKRSQELHDLGRILAQDTRTDEELANVLGHIARFYHRLRIRLTLPFERMRVSLGLDEEALRLVVANLQRYMHDLNSMVNFADLALATIRARMAAGEPVRPGPRPEQIDPEDAFAILHLSHRETIARRLAEDPHGPGLRDQYGGKASGLLYISHLGLPTRDGFVVPTWLPRAGLHLSQRERVERELGRHLAVLERDIAARCGVRKRFGRAPHPLLLAVRGGSVFSMPGMLATVVFAGMNDEIAQALAADGRWRAWDSYRRFLASFAGAVWGEDLEDERLVARAKARYGVQYKSELPWQAMREIVQETKTVLRDRGRAAQLDDILAHPGRQLVDAVYAVFASWDAERSQRYRAIKSLGDGWHTAALVQEMAFGNHRNSPIEPAMDESRASLTGVIPRTRADDAGMRELTGEIKFSAAGDDLVAGVTSAASFRPIGDLKVLMPMLERRLRHIMARLRRFMGSDQEVEFTVERGVLSVLQARTADRRILVASDRFADADAPVTRGIGISGGGFRGVVAFDEAERAALASRGDLPREGVDGVLLVLENPSPDDIPTILSADGLLTARGGSTSHAAVAINGLEDRQIAAVMSAVDLQVSERRREALIVDQAGRTLHTIRSGDVLSIHGTTGEVHLGSCALWRGDAHLKSGASSGT